MSLHTHKMEWHLDKTQLVESIWTSLVLKSGHFQKANWLEAFLPHALAQLSPNLKKYIDKAETAWTNCSGVVSTVLGQLMNCASRGSRQPAPGPLPASTQLLSTAGFCLWLVTAWPEPITPQATNCTCGTRTRTGHPLQSVLHKLAQASLFAGQNLNT